MDNQRVMGEARTPLSRRPNPRLGNSDLLSIHVLDGAQALPFVALDNLPVVTRTLTSVGSVVVVEYDDEWQRLTFYRQDAWLRGGRLAEDRGVNGLEELPTDALEP